MLRATKSGLLCLLIAATASAAPGGRAKLATGLGPDLNFDFVPVPLPHSPKSYLTLLVEPRRPASRGVMGGGGCVGVRRLVEICGGLQILQFPARKSKLADPVAALGAAYLNCHTIQAGVLDPRVPVARYPAGYFGDWVHEGVLVTARLAFTDEAKIGRIFALLMEALGAADDPDDFWFEESDGEPEASVSGYRRDTGFVPELVFDFVGAVPLRVELSLAQRRLLVQAGDKWDGYTLDRVSAAALKEFLATRGPR